MDHFQYRNGIMHAEDVPLTRIATEVGTPFYCYSTATMQRHYQVLRDGFGDADVTICYAVKANSNQSVIRTFALMGAGADVISGGELQRALAAGVPGNKIVFAGPGKTLEELRLGLAAGVLQFNVESEPELRALSRVASSMDAVAPVALRVNPDVDAKTHEKITTGRKENKFGISAERAVEMYALGQSLPGIEMVGLALHIGSQLTDLAPFEAGFKRAGELIAELRGRGCNVRRLNLGGGLGIPYAEEQPPSPADYGAMVRRVTKDFDVSLIMEPGRMLVGNAGVLVNRVIYEKVEGRRFVIVDGAMNDLIRPAMYDSYHAVVPVKQAPETVEMSLADVVGPICESSDFFAKQRRLPPFAPDDLIALRSAGAYGAVMASNYNSRPMLPEVLVNGDGYAVVRPRQTVEELIGRDRIAPWLETAP